MTHLTASAISELSGIALDRAVAECLGGTNFLFDDITWSFTLNGKLRVLASGWAPSMNFCPSRDWAVGGPIVEQERISLNPENLPCSGWTADTYHVSERTRMHGPTPLVAAMRCLLMSRLGAGV